MAEQYLLFIQEEHTDGKQGNMPDINLSSLNSIPKGTTQNRPSNPSIGDVYYNGTVGYLEIYSNYGWIPANLTTDSSFVVDSVRYGVALSSSIDGGTIDGIIDARVSESIDNTVFVTINGGTV